MFDKDSVSRRVSASVVLAAAFGLHCPTGDEPELNEVIAVCLTLHDELYT